MTRAGDRHVFLRLDRALPLVLNPAEAEKPPVDPALPVPPHGAGFAAVERGYYRSAAAVTALSS